MAAAPTGASDGLAGIRAELTARIAALVGRVSRATPPDLAREVDAIRVIAHRHGLDPAVTVAHFLYWALSRGERGVLLHGWLTLLGDAVASERRDTAACDSFAAACSVRLAAA